MPLKIQGMVGESLSLERIFSSGVRHGWPPPQPPFSP